jgi:3-oxoacyl-[acyl-carrier-protein] synthase I
VKRSPINIVAAGARTPLGLQAPAAAVALRAGIVALGEHPFMIDQMGDPMPGALDPELDPLLMGPNRLLALIETAMREACEPICATRESPTALPVYLGLPEVRPGFSAQDVETVRTGLARFKDFPAELRQATVFARGHAAGLLALATAVEQMQRGHFEACLVGGVDSYFHPDTMEWLDENRQLVGTISRSGFVPGEGAGVCLLVTDQTCKNLGLKAQVVVRAVAAGKETKLIKTEDICLGEGLSTTVLDAVLGLQLPDERINDVICDINGERYRGEEWGFVCLRLSSYFDDPTAYLSPAECWGDMGAASGPLFAMLVCQASMRGFSKGPRTMLWTSSEGGQRAVVVLEASGNIN